MDKWTLEQVKGSPESALAEIISLQSEIVSRDKLKLRSLHYENSKLDMRVGGDKAHAFLVSLVEFFKQNGGQSYVTLTVDTPPIEDGPGWHLEITIRNCNGTKTPAEEIDALKERVAELEDR